MWYEKRGDSIILYIKAQPNSSRSKIAGVYGDALKINIKAPAVEGAANKELIKFLSKSFKVPKSQIAFVSGETSKRKAIKLPMNEKIEEFLESMNEG
ncbi:DUF167 family protein [Nitratiruptor sp. YY09-18]|uniref:DUF167 domain-containing protein n=1 Tax=Nitratiruptor sp. YY09-18 TaxID=2724901 RepID=UPI0019160EE1|nr:DUF167 family protein [Nitratiruptor sp. YY09-18]BCD68607.1 hypothetical protein NitYY0918_C1524 [Nitratiruptor sp. YY09-18]